MPHNKPPQSSRAREGGAGSAPVDSRPLDQRLRDLADRLSEWVDSWAPSPAPAPVLVPVPVRKRRRR